MADEKDAYAGLSEEQIKENEKAMERQRVPPTPTQAEIDAVAAGHKASAATVDEKPKAEQAEQKEAAPEKPAAKYKTRTAEPERD